MPVEGVQGELPKSYVPSTVADAANKRVATTSLDKDAFLKLLVAQLKYQNPMSPADPTQFMSQTAQFTMVEELQNMAKDQRASALSQQITTASSMVGKQITWLDEDGTSQSGLVTAAQITNGSTVLMVDKVAVPVEAVQSIATAAPVVDPPATDGADGTDVTDGTDGTDGTGVIDVTDDSSSDGSGTS